MFLGQESFLEDGEGQVLDTLSSDGVRRMVFKLLIFVR